MNKKYYENNFSVIADIMTISKVIHIIPFNGIGGVEVAANSMGSIRQGDVEFSKDFIFKDITNGIGRGAMFNPLPIFSAAWRASRSDVDLVIVSLWRSAIAGLLAKLLRPQIKLVTFLHSSTDVHFLDFVVTRLSVCLATEVWADSRATLLGRVPGIRSEKYRVISFVTQRFEVLPVRPVSPSFIFWGRISQEKGLDRAIRLFAEVRKSFPDARFLIVGPDGGALNATQQLCASLGLKDAVGFLGAATHEEIVRHVRHASFYLQMSEYEGMGMSVVESMQLGLVPVVTPVGEIGSYCQHGENAVIVGSDQKAVEATLHLLNNNDSYQTMRANAIATWEGRPLYRESILQACEALVGGAKVKMGAI